MIDQLLTFIPAHDAQLLTLFGATCTVLSLFFGLSAKTVQLSKIFGAVSPADLIRIWKYLCMAVAWLQRWRSARKSLNGYLLVLLGSFSLMALGCAGTFNEAKLAGAKARTGAPPIAASTPARCQSLSERQYWFTGSGLALTAAGVAIAGLALPTKSDKVETILLISGASTTVTGGGLTWLGNSAGVNYTREGCGQ